MADIDHRLSRESVHRVGVVQAAPVGFDTLRTMQKVADLTADATRKGARLTLFPEAFISAYPRGLGFGAVVGARTPAGREQFRLYWESAIEVPGPHTETLSRIARTNRTHLVIGVIERDGGTLYCTVLFLWSGWSLSRQAPQAHAHGKRASDLGLRRWFDADGAANRHGAGRRSDLLGKLYAAPADGDVRQGCRDLLRADGGWPGHLGGDDAARRAGGAMLRPFQQSIRAPARLPGRDTRRRSATIRMRFSPAAGVASSIRSGRFSLAPTSAARRS